MARQKDSSVRALNREWNDVLADRPVPSWWYEQAPAAPESLGAVLAAIPGDADGVLGRLLRLNAGGARLAGRVVVQAMIGKMVRFAAADPDNTVGDYLAELWLVIQGYPLTRRPQRIAANLALDTRRRVRAERAAGTSVDPGSFDEWPQEPADIDAATVVRTARQLGLLDPGSGACLGAVYALGLRSHEAAAQLAISADLVRWRNARSIRVLARHRTLLAVA
jgi:hypothetical protein